MHQIKFLYVCILFFIAGNMLLAGKGFYVSSNANLMGDGSISNPWTLQHALNHPATLNPGDTVWIRAGVYTYQFDAQSNFSCNTIGKINAPIIFRNYNSERVILDGTLSYTLYAGLGKCSYTWFWGLEITNSSSIDRYHTISGGITCTAENIKFINMIVHDTGSGLDAWKSAKNTEIYGCILYHIGNNESNGGNWEGHGHGMYLQNDTFGIKNIHDNIIFSTYGYGIKIWQTTTTAPIGNFDIQRNIIFNGGSASENLGGVGNNYRTHNFFVLSNGPNNPLINTTIKYNYTYSGNNTPRPPVNAFGLNYGVKNLILDSNYLSGQTRLGYNNTPIFQASVKGNHIIAGIPPAYGYYLWGFNTPDFPENSYFPDRQKSGLEYFVLRNTYEPERSHLVIYNWDSLETVKINIFNSGLKAGDTYDLIQVMDISNDLISGVVNPDGTIQIPMINHSFIKPIGATQNPVSQFPKFGVFILRNTTIKQPTIAINHDKQLIKINPNPTTGMVFINNLEAIDALDIFDSYGKAVLTINSILQNSMMLDLSSLTSGIYFIKTRKQSFTQTQRLLLLN